MNGPSTYRLARYGNLLTLRAAVGSLRDSPLTVRLLVDTGSNYTVLSVEALENVGCDTHHPLDRVRIITADGVIVAPRVAVPWSHCLGARLDDFPVVAHTLPPGTLLDGLLGMDFLRRCRATISVRQATITVRQP